MNMKWNPPPPPLLYKLNVNGALNKARKLAGIGVIIWNEAGELIGALSKREPIDSLALGVVNGLLGCCCDLDPVDGGLRFVVIDGCDLLWVGGPDCCGSPMWGVMIGLLGFCCDLDSVDGCLLLVD